MESKVLLLIMKPFAAIAIAAFLFLPAEIFSQQVSLSVKDAPLQSVLKSIEQQTGVHFIYTKEQLFGTNPVSVDLKKAPLSQALKICFNNQPVSYSIDGNFIVVKFIVPTDREKAGTIKGRVVDEKGDPVPRVTVMDNRTLATSFTNDKGDFLINDVSTSDTLIFTSINMETVREAVSGRTFFVVSLKSKVLALGDVTVLMNNGYQNIPKERATGSFDFLNNELINRSVSTDILSRMDGVASGVIFNKNIIPSANDPTFSIRGRSTIFANPQPLIVVDNFPYDGDINNINPNDVESITILKDAAAASIWGARSGNGVVVITTKKGSYNRKPRISVNTNFTISEKPDLFYLPSMSSADYVGVEEFLFSKGYYNSLIVRRYPALSPAVDVLNQEKKGLISDNEADMQIAQLKNQDIRSDLEKYYYQYALSRQYSMNLSGGTANDQYYFSTGIDQNDASLVRNKSRRITLNANNTYSFWDHKIEFSSNIIFTSTHFQNDNNGSAGVSYPYANIADGSGRPLPVYLDYRKSYTDTAGQGLLLNWLYYPLKELELADNITDGTEYRILTGLKYNILKSLNATINYQYTNGRSDQINLYGEETYYTRNLINQFTQLDYSSGNVAYPIPLGSIQDKTAITYYSHNLRGQINFNNRWGTNHFIKAIAGAELKTLNNFSSSSRLYGYDENNSTSTNVDYVDYFLTRPLGLPSTLPTNELQVGSTDHFISYFANAAYTYRDAYTISASGRTDASNLFGVSTNQKTVPLWSIGLAWEISKEKFYKFKNIPYLKLRITDGYNGNVNKKVSAYTTAIYEGTNIFNANYSNIVNPPNPLLRWEKINIINIGLDFATYNKSIEGTIEYYHKNGSDIIGNSPLAPQTGVTQFSGNTAGIKGNGIDATINALLINKKIRWRLRLLWSYSSTIVSSYKLTQPAASNYISGNYVNPMEGKPYSSLFSYKWAGLDPQTGDPQGYINGSVSKLYPSLINPASVSDIVYSGTTDPVFFGSLLNNLSFGKWIFSFNVTYKMGNVFRRNSINYSALYAGTLSTGSMGNKDYEKRWQNPGDETHTNVPSMIYPKNTARDQFYTNSSILIDKADQIRLKDAQLSYSIKIKSLPIESLKLYFYTNNLWLIWKANKDGIDPDYVNSLPNPRAFSFGAKIDF
jgi:TonB-linked SusC/RagA family outer membrane protein